MMQHQLYGLRGKEFATEYLRLLDDLEDSIRNDFKNFLKDNKKFTANNLGHLCVKYQIPVKVMDEWLPHITEGVYRPGTWQRMKDSGIKARDIGVVWD